MGHPGIDGPRGPKGTAGNVIFYCYLKMNEDNRKEKTRLYLLSEQANKELRDHKARGAGRDQWDPVESLDHLVLERKETKVKNVHVYVNHVESIGGYSDN